MTDGDTSTASGLTDIKAELENDSLESISSRDSSFYGMWFRPHALKVDLN